MKILELRFKNLNSLYGEWHIDFTESEYAYNGIFALTGPTGAGKSTILDAICLALYGSTPRLGRITQNSNDIMSRQTGECYAEVVFASQSGRYRCHWAHHRSRKRADGELQSPRHEIAEANAEGKVIENQLKAVLGAVEEKTGMDFDRFTRSILLAQGGFDTFLKATVEQKSKILEQITGTKIYSDISIGVHERMRSENAALSTLEAETRGIPILSFGEELAIEEELKSSQSQEITLETFVSDLTESIAWLQGIAKLEKEIENFAGEEKELANDMLSFEPRRTILEGATKASSLEALYASLAAMRNQQKDELSSLGQEEKALPELEYDAKKGAVALLEAENHTHTVRSAQQESVPILRQVRSLDQYIDQNTTSIIESSTALEETEATMQTYKKEKENESSKEKVELKKLSEIESYFSEHASDKDLVTELTGILGQIQALESRQKEVAKKEGERAKAAKALDQAEKALANCKETTGLLEEKHKATKTNLQGMHEKLSGVLGKKTLREYRSEKDTLLLKMVYLHKIAELEEYRLKLEDGKECPLCGALVHPFAKGNVPVPDKTEEEITSITKVISDAEDMEISIDDLLIGEQNAAKALNEQKTLETNAHNMRSNALSAHTTARRGLEEAQAACASQEQEVAERLVLYGIDEICDDLGWLSNSLRARRDTWQTKMTDKQNIENDIHTIRGELQRLSGVADTQEIALKEKGKALKTLRDSLSKMQEERKTLFGDKKADDEEKKLTKAVSDAQAKEKEASRANDELMKKVHTSKTRIESLQSSLTKRKPVLETKEAQFTAELSFVGFSDEQQFLNAILTQEERNLITTKAKALDDRQTALQTNQKDRAARLGSEQAKAITDKPLTELQPLLVTKGEELKEIREAVAECKARLKGNIGAKDRIESKRKAIGDQKRECAKWEKLHTLIGSADGKKYRTFAQGLTFELMVSHANRQLAKMSDRYLLIRDEGQPLELNVIDNYQAGQVRSTKNLSGGESFIVSLTLALGLSKMASRKVRVDSLFLDEGFGTLDEASLETALKTLSGLQQDGKLIGVISHVSAMQEMISTQITITPASGGRSILAGPGCSKV